MLTPVFELQQTETHLIIVVTAPYAKVAETEVEYEARQVLFTSPPYFLRLYLPAEIVEDQGESGTYDADAGTFTFRAPKKEPGKHFEGLDLVTQLLRPQPALPSASRLVEELEGEGAAGDSDEGEADGEEYLVQQSEGMPLPAPSEAVDEKALLYGYGFAWRRLNVLGRLQSEIGNIVELEDCECTPIDERAQLSLRNDRHCFKAEHFLADTFEPDCGLESALKWEPPSTVSLTTEDRERLKDLPKTTLPRLSRVNEEAVARSLVDLVFAFCYDLRIGEGEECSETSWNYVKLAPSLSYFARWASVEEAVAASARRALVYPLYRSWSLVEAVFKDTKFIFSQGRTALLHVLCRMHSAMVSGGEFRYLFNDLLLTDLLLWIQSTEKDLLDRLCQEVQQTTLKKSEVGLDLESVEVEARLALMRLEAGTDVEPDSDDE